MTVPETRWMPLKTWGHSQDQTPPTDAPLEATQPALRLLTVPGYCEDMYSTVSQGTVRVIIAVLLISLYVTSHAWWSDKLSEPVLPNIDWKKRRCSIGIPVKCQRLKMFCLCYVDELVVKEYKYVIYTEHIKIRSLTSWLKKTHLNKYKERKKEKKKERKGKEVQGKT